MLSVLPCVNAYGCKVCVRLQGVSIINEKHPSVSGFLQERTGRGGSRGRGSGVKDNTIRRAVRVHYTVTHHSRFLSLPFCSSLFLPTVVDGVTGEHILDVFTPNFQILRTCQKVLQQQQVDFGIVSTHQHWIFESLLLTIVDLM